jgi:hypothetical protein
MTKNLHLEHPEDLLLTGNLWVLEELFNEPDHTSVKIDGAPAVVWGVDPATGDEFVGTKSVFNKRKIKICYSIEDIQTYYGEQPEVAAILTACWKYLPFAQGIYQGDFIGYGCGIDTLKPNTIEYVFPEAIQEKIVVAPHTYYEGPTLKDAVAFPLANDIKSNKDCLFIQPFTDKKRLTVGAPNISNPDVIGFLDDKQAAEAKKAINALIRNGQRLNDENLTEILGCPHLANLYMLTIDIKEDLMNSLIVYNSPTAYLAGRKVPAEGFVLHYNGAAIKLVDRPTFAHHNFNSGKFQ